MLQKKLVVLDMVGLNKKEELEVAERQKFVAVEDKQSAVPVPDYEEDEGSTEFHDLLTSDVQLPEEEGTETGRTAGEEEPEKVSTSSRKRAWEE